MRILVLGGDGYLGWPTALHLSARGHEVDGRRQPRAPRVRPRDGRRQPRARSPPSSDRVTRWEQVSGHAVDVRIGDLTDAAFTYSVVTEAEPDAIVHFGEQRSAPYSMIDREHAVYTQVNNVVGNLNVMYAIQEIDPDIHLVKLGTMGEYGYPNIDIEEGFIEITHKGRTDVLPYPKQPGLLLPPVQGARQPQHHVRLPHLGPARHRPQPGHRLRAVDDRDRPRTRLLATRFDYDGVFGTVLNRFCVQAVTGHPLTVYGDGGQTRGMLDIRDTLACVELACREPGRPGRVPGLQPVHRVVLACATWRRWSSASARRASTSPRVGPTRAVEKRGALLPRGAHQAARPRPPAAPPDRRGHQSSISSWWSGTGTGSTCEAIAPTVQLAHEREHLTDGGRNGRLLVPRAVVRTVPAVGFLRRCRHAGPAAARRSSISGRPSSLVAAVALLVGARSSGAWPRCRGSRRATTPPSDRTLRRAGRRVVAEQSNATGASSRHGADGRAPVAEPARASRSPSTGSSSSRPTSRPAPTTPARRRRWARWAPASPPSSPTGPQR